MQKNKLFWSVVIVLAFIVTVVAYSRLATVQLGQNKQTTNIVVETTNWKTYSNEEYGFEFKYLSGYEFLENTSFHSSHEKFEVWIDKDVSLQKSGAFGILVKDAKAYSINSTADWFKKNFENVVISKKNINGNNFTLIQYDNPGGGSPNEVAYTEHGGFIYVISYSEESKNFLDTFKFTK